MPLGTIASTLGAWQQWSVTSTATTTSILVWPDAMTQTTATSIDHYGPWLNQATNQLNMLSQQQAYAYQRIAAQERALQQGLQQYGGQQQRQLTAEQVAADHAELRVEYDVHNKAIRDAEERARVLLVANLQLREQLRLTEEGAIMVRGSSGCRYRIRKGRTANVDVIGRDGRVTGRLCAHPGIWTPDYDTMLAQKLSLESDDAAFLRIANRHHFDPQQIAEAE